MSERTDYAVGLAIEKRDCGDENEWSKTVLEMHETHLRALSMHARTVEDNLKLRSIMLAAKAWREAYKSEFDLDGARAVRKASIALAEAIDALEKGCGE